MNVKHATVGVRFIDNNSIKRYNKIYRGLNETTDVLSFSLQQEENDLGDILIAIPFVEAQAKEKHVSLREEVGMLIIHGALHLFGFNHETKKDEQKMFLMQNTIAKKVGVSILDMSKS